MELLVTGAWQDAGNHIAELEERGHRVHFLQYEKDELPCSPDQIEGVICNGLFLYHAISEFTRLRYIQLTSAGYDRVPMDYIREHNIEIHNARGVYSIPMAEYAIAGVLSLYKKLDVFRENQKQHKWEKQRDLLELYGKTVSIFGCGSVGCECAKRFAAFGARVIGVDIIFQEKVDFEKEVTSSEKNSRGICASDERTANGNGKTAKIEELQKAGFRVLFTIDDAITCLQQSDIIISTLPLAQSTEHFFGKECFEQMCDSSVFVNISRGGTVDTGALIQAIANSEISGAVLDVFEEEPLQDTSPLWDFNNVIITPHNSFVGNGNQKRLSTVIMSNLRG